MRRFLVALTSALALASCGGSPSAVGRGLPWPDADVLFHREPRWLGGDAAYSIDLGNGRVLWLFGDSFIATSDAHLRSQSTLVHNSVAIQTGADPTTAAMAFYWATGGDKPGSFFPDQGAEWLWPGHGARVGDKLLLFQLREHADPGGLEILADGSQALLVDDPDDPPPMWTTHPVAVPPNAFEVLIGAGGALVKDGYLYLMSPGEAIDVAETGRHDLHLMRAAVADAAAGDLSKLEWYVGQQGWVPLAEITERPQPVLTDGQIGLSIHWDAASARFIEVQVDGYGGANVAARDSGLLGVGWSDLATIFRPLEANQANTLVYSAKAHPELSAPPGATALTYCTNLLAAFTSVTDFTSLMNDDNIDYPRFVLLEPTGH